MKPIFELKVLQCDGSIKVYNERPWWFSVPIQPNYIHEHHTQRKHEKTSATMTKIRKINREAYIDSLLAQGRVLRKHETGKIAIHDVADKLRR